MHMCRGDGMKASFVRILKGDVTFPSVRASLGYSVAQIICSDPDTHCVVSHPVLPFFRLQRQSMKEVPVPSMTHLPIHA